MITPNDTHSVTQPLTHPITPCNTTPYTHSHTLSHTLSHTHTHTLPRPDVKEGGGGWSGAKGGDVQMDKPSQHVLERTNVQIIMSPPSSSSSSSSFSLSLPSNAGTGVNGYIEARFTVGLPARGRSIEGHWAATILTKTVPSLALDSLRWCALDTHAATSHVHCVEDQHVLRSLLADAR